jgi:hypothetical protein
VDELDSIRHAVTRSVPAGHIERFRRDVGRDDARIGPFARERDGEASAAGTDIGDGRGCRSRHELERCFDDELGLGPGDEHRRIDLEIELPEFTPADDVGERLAGRAATDQRVEARRKIWRFALGAVGEELLRRPPEHVLREQPRAEVGFVGADPGVAQLSAGLCDAGLNRHETTVASFSFSD